jgi:hypothetical protein
MGSFFYPSVKRYCPLLHRFGGYLKLSVDRGIKVIKITLRSFFECSDIPMKKRQTVPPGIQSLSDAGTISVTKTSDEVVFSVSDSQAWPFAVEYFAQNVAAIAAQEELSVRVVDPDGNSTVYPYRPSIRGAAAARRRTRDGVARAIGDIDSGPHPL